MIFNDFSKVQPGHPRSENWVRTDRSLGFAFWPLKKSQTSQCNPSDGDRRNPARGRPFFAGKGWGSDPCSPRVPFRWLEGSEEVPVVVLGGALHPWPPLPRFQRGDHLWSWSGGRGRCRGVTGRQMCAQGWGWELRGGIAMAEWTEENNEYPTVSRRR
jgi:hypothetical protein